MTGVRFDLSKNHTFLLPSKKACKKAAQIAETAKISNDNCCGSSDCSLDQPTIGSLTESFGGILRLSPSGKDALNGCSPADSAMLSPSMIVSPRSSVSSSLDSLCAKSILKNSHNPHLSQEWTNVVAHKTLNMRESEIQAWRHDIHNEDQDDHDTDDYYAHGSFDSHEDLPHLVCSGTESCSDSEHLSPEDSMLIPLKKKKKNKKKTKKN